MEVIYRGYSHYSMFILGGICFLYAGIQNEFTDWEQSIIIQVLKVWIFVLISEFITGCIVNIWLDLNVWDYSNLPFNILGQSCLYYALLFILICIFAIILDDYVRYFFFKEEKPHYHIINTIKKYEI